ncbi:retrotransposon protein, putative, ty1-copia subclass [Tanacetum coccineum]
MQASSIYGLRQASRSWNKRFDEEIKKFGYTQNLDEPCLYQKASGSNITFLILYVDDIIIMGNHILMIQDVKSYLGRCFAMKDLEEAALILGIKIYRDRSKRLIGLRSIMYVVRCTRPDVVFTVNITSHFQQNLGEKHQTAMKNILKHLRNSRDMFFIYGRNLEAELRVTCYCDAGFKTNRDDIKSQTGFVFVLNGGIIEWKSSKKSVTAMYAIETKYIATS